MRYSLLLVESEASFLLFWDRLVQQIFPLLSGMNFMDWERIVKSSAPYFIQNKGDYSIQRKCKKISAPLSFRKSKKQADIFKRFRCCVWWEDGGEYLIISGKIHMELKYLT